MGSVSTPARSLPRAVINQRIGYLNSVRGLAVFSVLVYHFIGWKWGEELPTKLWFMVFNGSDAVSLFFVLSGLVLSWRFFQYPPNETPPPITWPVYRQYLVSRVIRLYLPFLVLLPIYYGYVHWHDTDRALDFITNRYQWLEEAMLIRGTHAHYGPAWTFFLLIHLLGGGRTHAHYGPAWTLEVEVAGSLLLPFMVLLLRHDQRLFLALQVVLLVLGGKFVFWGLFHFGLGMWLAYFFRPIATYDIRRAPWYPARWVVYGLIFLLFSVRHLDRIHWFGKSFNNIMNLLQLDLFHLTGVAAAALLALLALIINQARLQQLPHRTPVYPFG